MKQPSSMPIQAKPGASIDVTPTSGSANQIYGDNDFETVRKPRETRCSATCYLHRCRSAHSLAPLLMAIALVAGPPNHRAGLPHAQQVQSRELREQLFLPITGCATARRWLLEQFVRSDCQLG